MYVLNIMNHILPRGIPATVISLEMSRVQILSRMIGMEMGISATNVLKAYADESSMTDIEMKKGVFSEYPLTVHDRHFTLQSIKSILRKEKIKNKMRVAVIDFVQNISSEESKTEYAVLTESVRDLQELAKELGITIICVSQLNNASVDSRGGKVASGMKGTGAAEYVADMVIKLERNREKESILDEDEVPIRMVIHKNRNGAAGAVGNYILHRHSGKIEKSTVVDDGDSADDGYVLPPEKKLKRVEWEN
jgi:replicative DNA helicase